MAVLSNIQRKLGKFDPGSMLANKYDPGAKDLLSITEKPKEETPYRPPLTRKGKAAAAAGYSPVQSASRYINRGV